MTRSLKIIGLALLSAALVTGALVATGAFAGEEGEGEVQGFLIAESYPAILDGTDNPKVLNAFTFFGLKIECPDSSYKAEVVKPTSVLFFEPTYSSNCKQGARKATVTTNGCNLRFDIRGTTEKEPWVDNYFLTSYIICPTGKDIEIHIYQATDNENAKYCEITIKEQTLINRAKLQNEPGTPEGTTGTFKLENYIEGITATKSSGFGGCGNETNSSGKYHIGIDVKGTTTDDGPNKLFVTD
jgi:hypothetical protein